MITFEQAVHCAEHHEVAQAKSIPRVSSFTVQEEDDLDGHDPNAHPIDAFGRNTGISSRRGSSGFRSNRSGFNRGMNFPKTFTSIGVGANRTNAP